MAGANPFSKTLPLTSLGAVGGPRGTAAGVLRVLVDFAVTFDAERVKQLESEIQKLQGIEQRAQQRRNGYLQQQQQVETRITNIQQTRSQLGRTQIRNLDNMARRYSQIQRIEEKITQGGILSPRRQQIFQQQQQALQAQIQAMAQQSGLGQAQIQQAVRLNELTAERIALQGRLAANEANIAQLVELTTVRQQEAASISQFRDMALPRLLGLGVGAVGNIFGGALLGVGFQAGYAAVDAVTEKLRDLVDPATKAREVVDNLAQAINDVASDQNLSGLEKTAKYLESLGPAGSQVTQNNPQAEKILATALATDKLNKELEQLNQIQTYLDHGQEAYQQSLNNVTNMQLKYTDAAKNLIAALGEVPGSVQLFGSTTEGLFGIGDPELFDNIDKLGAATEEQKAKLRDLVAQYIFVKQQIYSATEANAGLGDSINTAAQDAEAFAQAMQDALNQNLADAFDARMQQISDSFEEAANRIRDNAEAAKDSFAAASDAMRNRVQETSDARINTLQDRLSGLRSTPSARTRRLQDALGNLGSGDSARTRALQAQIDALNKSQERRAYLSQLAAIQEERYQLVLAHTLENSTKAINIYKYAGQARVTAIDASIKRLQKQQAEQDRLNKLLDLEYEASKRINREEGESIQDFLSRRAQEYRHQIADRQELERQGKEDRLAGLKEETEYRIALAENAQKRLEAIRDRELKLHQQHLQNLLSASQEADRKAQAAQRDALQKQLQASQEADRKELDRKRKHVQDLIEAERKQRDARLKEIDEAQKAYNKAIDAQQEAQLKANAAAQKAAEKAEKAKQEAVKKLTDKGQYDQLLSAYRGAKTLGDLNLLAGKYAGAGGARGQLEAYVEGLGLSTPQSTVLLASLKAQRSAYFAAMNGILQQEKQGIGLAGGGVFELTNAMNFGRNIRVGEQGKEFGMVLSNRVVQALKDRKGGPMVGTINIESKEDPRQAVYRMKKAVRELQESQL